VGHIESILKGERLLFDHLYRSSVIDYACLDEFASSVVRRTCQILDSMGPVTDVTLVCEPGVLIRGDDAFHLGVLLNELLFNSLAGPGGVGARGACLLLELKKRGRLLEIISVWNGPVTSMGPPLRQGSGSCSRDMLMALVVQRQGRLVEEGPGILRIEVRCSLRQGTCLRSSATGREE
jgi:two-component sensor histidine kinase